MSLKTYFQDPSRSTIQESLVESWFIRDFILAVTRRGKTPLIGRSDIDLYGFDIILGLDDRDEFLLMQLKAYGGSTDAWDVHKALLQKRSQVVVAQVDYTAEPPTITYRALSREGRVRALARAPRKEHPGKCMVKKADLQVVTDLMELFEF